eukprot:13723950-Alexandrium_andersonii.AAC.1
MCIRDRPRAPGEAAPPWALGSPSGHGGGDKPAPGARRRCSGGGSRGWLGPRRARLSASGPRGCGRAGAGAVPR